MTYLDADNDKAKLESFPSRAAGFSPLGAFMKRLTSAAAAVALTALAVSTVTASAEPKETKARSGVFNSHLSQSVLFHQAWPIPTRRPLTFEPA